MARRGRKRKLVPRQPSGKPSPAAYEPAVSQYTLARRIAAAGPDLWKEPDAGWLIGVWYLRGELVRQGEGPEMAGPRRDAARSYFKAITEMRAVLEARGHVDSLAQFQPRGGGRIIDAARQALAFARYDARFRALGGAGRHVRQAVHAALEDDTGASRELVIEGLQALVDHGLT